MKDFRTVTLADQVFERLESDIIQGVYPRGEVLTELRLVEQLNVSRTPIREALRRLREAGVTSYHHNIETSRRFFPQICTTHTYDDRIRTIKMAQEEGFCVCSGGIILDADSRHGHGRPRAVAGR